MALAQRPRQPSHDLADREDVLQTPGRSHGGVAGAAVAPLAITTFVLARRKRFETHQRFARITLPLWLYVSVTGVVVYWMLYRMTW